MVEFNGKLVSTRKNLFPEELLDSELELRDRHNFDIKFDYFLQKGTKHNKYVIDGYIFVPDELKISKETYPSNKFFKDVRSSIRFQTPIFPLKAIIRENNPLSPLNRVRATLDQILGGSMDDDALNHRLIYELRMYAQIVRSNLRSQVAFLMELCPREDSIEIVMESVHDLCTVVHAIQEKFHDLEATFFTIQMPEKTRSCYLAADEYVSYYIEHYFTALADKLASHACFKLALPEIHDLISRRQFRRKQMEYTLVIDGDRAAGGKGDLTRFHYWKSFLKRYIKQVLFLEIKEMDERRQLSQVIGGVGAFIAMGITVLITVLLLEGVAENSLPFILLVLVAYVLKDRIKAFVNYTGEKLLSKYVPDRKYDIIDPVKKEIIGTCEESMRFVKAVPDVVMSMRNKDRTSVLEREFPTEQIIHYHKTISLNTAKIFKIHERHKNLNDLINVNIRDYLANAWEPHEDIIHYNVATSAVERVKIPVTYHLNLVLKQAYFTKDKVEKVRYKRLRVIFTKHGITGIEEINI